MHIDHIAIWSSNLERLKNFYETFLSASAGQKYTNESKHFESYFLSFSSGARIEIMSVPDLANSHQDSGEYQIGYTHLAISVGSKEQVESLTHRIEQAGYRVVSGPRYTGDGYYESAILDPDGNHIEITI
ncbi:MAG: VOC family protein [Anaerolineales bacterium]|nr:VOC family protein [Anaerolineales bacterium]